MQNDIGEYKLVINNNCLLIDISEYGSEKQMTEIEKFTELCKKLAECPWYEHEEFRKIEDELEALPNTGYFDVPLGDDENEE